ncbi:YgaB family protein [Ectobacillus antri]|uniref:YgaB family protein n=1 Tax=Ectobacillus antri TaxID=2486280 RepID=A0ABT6H642_9BACI|nr:YgaB family protein [Ectobacillus antri]MDG4657216.1 YgaB family protein [Ectobacillus antri]MDG5754432.1 YgaB family protein [Ectobacillus antri]
MNEFDRLVEAQLKTMDQLLDLQTTLERYQIAFRTGEDVAEKILDTKQQLQGIQELFEIQTKQIIESFERDQAVHT